MDICTTEAGSDLIFIDNLLCPTHSKVLDFIFISTKEPPEKKTSFPYFKDENNKAHEYSLSKETVPVSGIVRTKTGLSGRSAHVLSTVM